MSDTSRFNIVWKSKALAVSILLGGCGSWTLTAKTEIRIQGFEMKCFSRLLRICYMEHKTNKCVRQQVDLLAGKQGQCCQRRNNESSPGLSTSPDTTPFQKIILQGPEGKKKNWLDNLQEWIYILTRFNKITIPNNKFQMTSGQGSRWLIESPTLIIYV